MKMPPLCRARGILFLLVSISIPLKGITEILATNVSDPQRILQDAQDRLRKQFDTWVQQPNAYAKRAATECSVFPEGEVYPYALPAMAYCNLVRSNPRLKSEVNAHVLKLIDLLIPATAKCVRSPAGDLMRMAVYEKQGTFLSTLNIALGSYAVIGPESKYKPLHAHISRLLYRAMEDLDGKPIESYPEYTWYFDSIMALVSLRLFEDANGLPRRSDTLLEKHLKWRDQNARDTSSGLPVAQHGGLPRGCDLSMQVCLLAQIDLAAARKLYDRYANYHWADYGVVAGFTEWPKGRGLFMTGDIDSGPLVLGIGMTATGVGLGAALALGDGEKLTRLATQLEKLPSLVKSLSAAQGGSFSLFDGAVAVNPFYLTGFLYGDAVLFYSLTCKPK